MFYNVGVLENFAKICKKTPLLGSLFNKETAAQMLSCEFGEIFKSTSFTKHLQMTASVNRQKALNLISRDLLLS